MSPKPKATSKKPAPAPVDPKKAPPAKEPTGPIWEKKPKNFAIGGDMQVILKAKQAYFFDSHDNLPSRKQQDRQANGHLLRTDRWRRCG